jgi:hypothetical protein
MSVTSHHHCAPSLSKWDVRASFRVLTGYDGPTTTLPQASAHGVDPYPSSSAAVLKEACNCGSSQMQELLHRMGDGNNKGMGTTPPVTPMHTPPINENNGEQSSTCPHCCKPLLARWITGAQRQEMMTTWGEDRQQSAPPALSLMSNCSWGGLRVD